MELTAYYALLRLGAGDSFARQSWKFTDGDRTTIDALLHVGAESHHHTGAAAAAANPTAGPGLTLDTTEGTLPADSRVYYKVSLVDPGGLETAASPEAYIDMPAAIVAPAAASLIVEAGGTLLPGDYHYALSAYYPTNTEETAAPNVAYVPVLSGSDNRIRLTFPTLPAGATGWNVYRMRPGEVNYFHMATVVAPATNWIDDGSIAADCDRRRPTVNNTNSTNSVIVALPSALPTEGWTWKVYRTTINSNYLDSLLHHVVEETFEGSGVTATTHRDRGGGTFPGQPLNQSLLIASPSSIALADGEEVDGRLPLGNVQGIPFEVTFIFLGPLQAASGTARWICEFPRATIIGVRAALGRGYSPAAQDVITDVEKGSGLNPTPATIFTDTTTRPNVLVGNQIGTRTTPQVIALAEGDSLTADVVQSGGGATPTDRDLSVTVSMIAQFDRAASDMVWD